MPEAVNSRCGPARVLLVLLLALALWAASALAAERAEALSVYTYTFCTNVYLAPANSSGDKCISEFFTDIHHVKARFDPSPYVRVCAGAKNRSGGNAIAFQCADGGVETINYLCCTEGAATIRNGSTSAHNGFSGRNYYWGNP